MASLSDFLNLLRLVTLFGVLPALVNAGLLPAPPSADWRLHALSADATSGSASFANGTTGGSTVDDISVSSGSTWTGTIRIPTTAQGGMLTFSFALSSNLSTAGYTAEAWTSIDSTDGSNGTWSAYPLDLYRTDRRVYNKLQKVEFDGTARWLRLSITAPASESGAIRDLGLYSFSSDGTDDYWLCIGASIQERGVNNTLFKNRVQSAYGHDPVIFNVAIGGYTTDDWYDGYPNNLLQQVLDAHPHARYVAIHIGGNNVTDERPYVDATTDSGDRNMAEDLAGIIRQVLAAGKYPLVSRISFRDYPAPAAVNAGANPENGSLPYNTEILDPLIAELLPEQIDPDTGRSFIDAYTYFLNNQSLLSSDGVHLNTADETLLSTTIWPDSTAPLVYSNSRPRILAQPAPVAALIGDSVIFRVVASGTGLTYQWLKNGSAITDATSSTLSLDTIDSGDFGGYSVLITNTSGEAVFSEAAVLSLVETNATTRRRVLIDFGTTITTNPANGEYWNNVSVMTTGTAIAPGAMLDDHGAVVSDVSLRVDSNFGGSMTGSLTSTTNTTAYPLTAASDGFYVNGSDTVYNNGVGPSTRARLTFTGLGNGQGVTLGVFGSRQYTDLRNARFTINGSVAGHQNDANNTTTVTLHGQASDPAGELAIDIQALDASGTIQRYAYLNVLEVLIENDPLQFDTWAVDHIVGISRAATDDPDHDGVSNLMEFAMGTNPNSATSVARPAISYTEDGTAVRLVYRRVNSIAAHIHYEFSTNLTDWKVLGAKETILNADTDGDGAVQTVAADFPLSTATRLSLRIRITPY